MWRIKSGYILCVKYIYDNFLCVFPFCFTVVEDTDNLLSYFFLYIKDFLRYINEFYFFFFMLLGVFFSNFVILWIIFFIILEFYRFFFCRSSLFLFMQKHFNDFILTSHALLYYYPTFTCKTNKINLKIINCVVVVF